VDVVVGGMSAPTRVEAPAGGGRGERDRGRKRLGLRWVGN
jgi:hypothetical protein